MLLLYRVACSVGRKSKAFIFVRFDRYLFIMKGFNVVANTVFISIVSIPIPLCCHHLIADGYIIDSFGRELTMNGCKSVVAV
jgi:hypothetical protein